MVRMAHPAGRVGFDPLEQRGVDIDRQVDVAVFAFGCRFDPSAQLVSHELCAIADAQDGQSELKDFRAALGRIIRVD